MANEIQLMYRMYRNTAVCVLSYLMVLLVDITYAALTNKIDQKLFHVRLSVKYLHAVNWKTILSPLAFHLFDR